LDLGLLRQPAFLGDVAVSGIVQFGLLAAVLHSSLYLQDLLNSSPVQTGVAVLAMILPITVAAQGVRHRAARRGLAARPGSSDRRPGSGGRGRGLTTLTS
jgi:hypothetical protein